MLQRILIDAPAFFAQGADGFDRDGGVAALMRAEQRERILLLTIGEDLPLQRIEL